MTDSTAVTPAGWYPDPAGGGRSRWWDGAQWTEHYHDPYAVGAQAAALKAPEGTPVYNLWIWLIVFIPYLSLPLLFTIDFASMFRFDPNDPSSVTASQLELFTSPAYLLLGLSGWVLAAAAVFFAYRDWKWLQAAGVPKPFHWAWAFFSLAGYPVYAIGRAVVTNRRTGKGIAVMWVTIGMLVLAFIVAIAWGIALMSTMFSELSQYYPGLN